LLEVEDKDALVSQLIGRQLSVIGSSESLPPQIRYDTSDAIGKFALFGMSPTGTNNPDKWGVTFWGNNIAVNGAGTDMALIDSSKGGCSLTMENGYNYGDTGNYGSAVSEFYWNNHAEGDGGGAFRGITGIGNQEAGKNNEGNIFLAYPTHISSADNTLDGRFGNLNHALTVSYKNDSGGGTLRVQNTSTNSAAYTGMSAVIGASSGGLHWKPSVLDLYHNSNAFIALSSSATGVLIGGSSGASASTRVHLGGATTVDGAILSSAGTAATPGISFTSATNGGMFFDSVPCIAASGTKVARFTQYSIGVGASATPGLSLNVNSGGGATGYLALQFNTASAPFTIGAYSGGVRYLSISADGTAITSEIGNLVFATAGTGIKIKEGSNARMGTATLSSGTVTVSNTSVTANTRFSVSRVGKGSSTAIGALDVGAVTSLTSFVINALKADATTETGDLSVVHWILFEPAP